jgi:nitrogen-specific signal transduction histidine kinase
LSDKYNASHPVTVVCDWDKPPYEYLNNDGEPSGSNIDIMRAVMKEIGIPVKFVMKEWSIALKTFERGDADIILANARRYRKEPYYVSENIVNYNRVRVATHADSTGMITFHQLEREGAVFKPGDYSANYFLDGDSSNTAFMEFQTPKVALLGVLHGDYKYFVWGEEPLKWKIKELNIEGITLNDVGIPISEVHVVGFDRALVDQIDDHYSRLKQRGAIAVIQDRWFHPERIQEKTNYTWLNAIIGILILAGIMYFLNRLARSHVRTASRSFTELNEMMTHALHMGNFIVMEYDIQRDRFTNHYGQILPDSGLTLEEFTSRIHPDQQQEFSQKMQSLMDGRERRFELDKRWNAGTPEAPEWLNFNGHAICELDSDGKPAYIVNAIHNVTQEMEEEQAARNLIHKYQVLSNVPFVALSFYDKNGFLSELNDNMKDLCGMDTDHDAQRFWETVNMFDVPIFRGVCELGFREDRFFCQHMLYPEYDIDKYIECSIQPLFNAEGDVVSYFIMAFDISQDRERAKEIQLLQRACRQTNEQIRLQHEQLEYLLLNSERYIMQSDIGKEQISFCRTPDEPVYVHSFSRFQRILAEDDRNPVMDILYDTTNRTPTSRVIHLIQPSKGQPGIIFSITFSPVVNEEGEITGHEGIASDITRISNTRQQLVEETQRAEDSVRMKSAFMASMTHELRTPLNAIVGFTSVLEALGDSPERAEYVRIIRNSSDMLQRLISDIIEASSMEAGALSIEAHDIDFAHEFEDICITLEQRVQNPEVTFQKENPYEHLHTTLDIGRIQQILTNFVTNAVKFTTKGHIKLGYEYREKGAGSEESGIYLYCEDTGKGIPAEKQASVFERFVKLDEFVQGTGMGLAISKSIAERCGGKIGVNSEGEGKGSTFYAWIPCEAKDEK